MTQNRGFVFFPQKENVGPFVSFFFPFPLTAFNTGCSTVLKKAHVEICFQECNSEWTLCFPLEGLRAPTHISGEWGGGGVQNASYSLE